ncbi:MAG: NADH-quinone oxidoreductase subunit C [Chloroflexi bacterium]|nr:NADH-quinone oxidoreductase subunit C [Chloroflexota bacterium]
MTTTLPGEAVAQRIVRAFPGAVEEVRGDLVYVAPDRMGEVCRFLHDDPELDMQMLSSMDVADLIDRFELRYNLLSLRQNHRAVLKARIWGREDPVAPSVTPVWEGANLQEREIYDLFGVRFEGHPNMKRVMLWEGFPGHPLRKDFP